MSEEENEKSIERSMTDDGSEPDEENRLQVAPSRQRKPSTELRHPRQKFCARWEKSFIWLKPNKLDASLGVCTVCDKNLVCKKSHLERHEKSFKHQRLIQKFYNNSDTHPKQPEFLECGRRDFDDEYEQTMELDNDFKLEFEVDSKLIKKEPKVSPTTTPRELDTRKATKLDRMSLLKRIDQDRKELNEYYYSRTKQDQTPVNPVVLPLQMPRDSIDLFFDSISASVKSLPPKLAAEVKSQVSQMLAEYELRAICEREAMENSVATDRPSVLKNESYPALVQESTESSEPVSHYVYTYQTYRNKH